MKNCVEHLRQNVMKFADPRPLVKTHPWATLTGAAAVGFIAATIVTPSKGGSISDKLSHLKGNPSETKADVAQKSSILSMIVTFVMTTLMNLAKEAFTEWSSAPAHAEARAPAEDSHAAGESDPWAEVAEDSGV